MDSETETFTPAVERAAELLIHEAETTGLIREDVRNGLAAALDVEEIAPILRQVATGNGGWTYLTERTKRKWREAAQEFRTALLGADS